MLIFIVAHLHDAGILREFCTDVKVEMELCS